MSDAEPGAADPFEAATAAAYEDIYAAMDATAQAAPDRVAAPTSAAAAGHGTIRLRGQTAPAQQASGDTGPAPRSAGAAAGAGHGTIRLRG